MQQDQGPRFQLGFGVQPSRYPFTPDPNTTEGPNPNSGFIAKALYNHPVARFFTVATASMVGMAVASKVVHSGGVKLFENFGTRDLPFLSRQAQQELLKDHRRVQSIFDEWEGVARIKNPGKPDQLIKRSSYFLNRARKERAAEEALEGGFAEHVEDWTFRDSIQQRLVHEARALPYQLPALYIANRAANTLTGQQNSQVNWYNPVDVIGDFAQQSLKNVATMLAPATLGHAGLKHGWQKLMSQGDFAASTSTFAPHIRNTSLALQTIMQQVGQDASSILYQTVRLGQQSAGSFGSAINEATISRKPWGFRGIDWNPNLFKSKLRDNPDTLLGFKRFKLVRDAYGANGFKSAASELMPTISGFGRGWRRSWYSLEDEYLNREAARRGDKTYLHRGVPKNVDLHRIHATSDVASIVDFLNLHDPTGDEAVFAKMRKDAAYSKLLEEELATRIASGAGSSSGDMQMINLRSRQFEKISPQDIAKRVVRNLNLTTPIRKSAEDYSPRQEMVERVRFGTKKIYDSTLPGQLSWEKQFEQRIQAIIPGYEGRITRHLPHAMASADRRFLDKQFSQDLTARTHKEWKDIRERVIVPYAKERLGEASLSYEQFGKGSSPQAQELLIRKTAEQLGIPLRENGRVFSTADLRDRLARRGVNVKDPYDMRAILVDQGIISKPWTKGSFNLLGMRPLTMQTALQRNYFGADQRRDIQKLYGEIGELDHPYIRNLVNRRVGRNVWETRTGRIVDLNPVIAAGHKVTQVAGRQIQVPFLHFNPFDILGLNTRARIIRKPIIQIQPTSSRHFGRINADAPESHFDNYIWMRHRGTKGRVAAHRLGEDVTFARGTYHPMPTMGESKEARNTRIAWGDKGTYTPRDLSSMRRTGIYTETSRQKWRRRFALDYEQPDSLFGLGRRFLEGEFGERHLTPLGRRLETRGGRLGRLGRRMQTTPDIRNPAVLARILRAGGLHNLSNVRWEPKFLNDPRTGQLDPRLENIWGEAYSNLDKELRRFPITSAISRGVEQLNPELGAKLKVVHPTRGVMSLADIHDPHEMQMAIRHTLKQHMTSLTHAVDAGTVDKARLGDLKSAQGFLNKVYLRERAEALSDPASRTKGSTGIHTRLDEMRADAYRYLVAREGIVSGDPNTVIQDLLATVDQLSLKGHISGTQRTEARAAILSMQINMLSLAVRKQGGSALEQVHDTLANLLTAPGAAVLRDIENYDQQLLHSNKFFGIEPKVRRFWRRHAGMRPESFEGVRYNPFSAEQDTVFMPSFGTTLMDNPWRSIKANILGFTTYSDREMVSPVGIAVSHFHQRLNRYFQMLGLGVDETSFKGPTGMLNWGLIGRRVFPAVAGTAVVLGVDRELGGLVHGKDQYGNRQYRPLFTGAIATGLAHLDVGIHYLGGPQAAQEKREELFGDKDVPVRRGRWWPLGNQPWQGGKIMYYRPSWYRRYMSGYQYTSENYGSPFERLAFDYDFSPGHFIPVVGTRHWERQHAQDRPYPVSGDLFTGPWGPLTTELNATVGRILKPHRLMHQDEFNQAMSQYQRFGQYGMVPPQYDNPYQKVVTRGQSGGVSIVTPTPSNEYLNQPYPTGATSIRSGGGGLSKGGAPVAYAPGDADTLHTTSGTIHMAKGFSFNPRVIQATNPINPGQIYYQGGQFGYEAQEMAGIYGFASGTSREMLGFGNSSFTPNAPVLQQASRGYGTERGFWDLNLGGLGDFPTPFQGEYGNIEFSEIARRFIPHRRRDINELNPIPNQMGQKYPWLPSSDYFIDFTKGDPYIAAQEGELRLPGPGYELTHQLHPDQTGEYGLLDKHRILGNIAPWSEEYHAVDRLIRKQNLSPEGKAFAQETREQVAGVNKRHNFYPYKYAHQNFRSQDVQVTGFKPGEADELLTNVGTIRLAGVRAKKSADTMALAQQMIHKGDTVRIMYDVNRPPERGQPVEATVSVNGQDYGQALMARGLGYSSGADTPLNRREQEGSVKFGIHRLFERAAHLNTLINQKFYPHRTATEEWERYNVYGSDFPQWNHPFRDYIEPLGYRAMNRNPIQAAAVLSVVGGAFGTTPQARTAGRLGGGVLGASLAMRSNAKSFETGSRFIPQQREEQLGIEEYSDILQYVKYAREYSIERQEAIDRENSDPERIADQVERSKYGQTKFTNLGPHTLAALEARKKMKQTMYGADLHGNIMDLAQAIPKRKRDFFMEFINAPVNERARILSTAPRLERRIYEARWGMRVEQRPDLVDYFSQHELPDSNWEGWGPNVTQDQVKIKLLQSQGLDASQMGFYPQQVQEANLVNPSYPDYQAEQSRQEAAAKLRTLMLNSGINGTVSVRRTNTPGTSLNIQMGTY